MAIIFQMAASDIINAPDSLELEDIPLRTVSRPPVSHRPQGGGCPTLDIDKDPKVLAFLDALAHCGQVAQAARAVGISPKTAYRWRQAYPALAPRWAAALEQGLDSLEDEAVRRAFEGSDRLLMFVLSRRRPEVYSGHQAKSQVSGTTKHAIDFNDGRWLPRDDLREIETVAEVIEAAGGPGKA
jgi:hypothetical protein